MCSYRSDTSMTLQWKRITGSTPSEKTGPSYDHTQEAGSGHYIYAEASNNSLKKARLLSMLYTFTETSCVTFNYHMYGKDMGTLRVMYMYPTNGTTALLWYTSGAQGDVWNQKSINVTKGTYRILYEATIGKGYRSDIALDDISVDMKPCSQESDVSSTIRLVGGARQYEGRVEIFHDNEWGTICDDVWGDKDADVVCSMLGYRNGGVAFGSAKFGKGSGPIFLDNVQCVGNESSIEKCDHNGWTVNNCAHFEDASVKCFSDYVSYPPVESEDVDGTRVRLAGNYNKTSGAVEMTFNGTWFPICQGSRTWNNLHATVVCRMMDYSGSGKGVEDGSTGRAKTVPFVAWHQAAVSSPCFGNETSLKACRTNWILRECTDSKYAGVTCRNKTLPIAVRLVNGTRPGSGVVQIYHRNKWHVIFPATDKNWNMADANVVCNQLGFRGAKELIYHPYKPDAAWVYSYRFRCSGKERNVGKCYSGVYRTFRFVWQRRNQVTNKAGVVCLLDQGAENEYMRDKPKNCDFESGFCGFAQDATDKFNWLRFKGKTFTEDTGPDKDHTPSEMGEGYYLYAEASFPRKSGEVARINAISQQSMGEQCLVFFYHMYGSGMGTLRVIQQLENGTILAMFNRSGSDVNSWKRAQLDLQPSENYRLTLEATLGDTYSSDIALDDFSILEHKCNENNTECGDEDFRCPDNVCIPKYYVCNNFPDCINGTDEHNCTCPVKTFKCGDGTCIPDKYQCDGRIGCEDKSDEVDCECAIEEFKCHTPEIPTICIPKSQECDGKAQCPDSSDEMNCVCSKTQFKCDEYLCKDISQWCDGEKQCPSGEDEPMNCTESCRPDQLRCESDDKCVPKYQFCDGVHHCEDNTDEPPKCECILEQQFKCRNGQNVNGGNCIGQQQVCDGRVDCTDHSDEHANCLPSGS